MIEMDVCQLIHESEQHAHKITIEATVPTGFEEVAFEECKEKLGKHLNEIRVSRGRIIFNTDINQIPAVDAMRSIDHVFVIACAISSAGFSGDMMDDFEIIKSHVALPNWKKFIELWKDNMKFQGICYPTNNDYLTSFKIEQELKNVTKMIINNGNIYSDEFELQDLKDIMLDSVDNILSMNKEVVAKLNIRRDVDISKKTISKNCISQENARQRVAEKEIYRKLDKRAENDKVLKYRVTCYRSGKHCFGSQDAANHFGGTLQDMFKWIVNLSIYDMEIVLNIKNDTVYGGIALTRESKHCRNITHFGPTTLRATVCYNLLRLGMPMPGDIILDPMCGGGSIPIEGVLAFPGTFHLCGDIHPKATDRAKANINENIEKRKSNISLLSWDVTKLPLRDSCVDIFVTDLPFGKRSGSKLDNRTLYKEVLSELGRVVRSLTGRAVLLTQDRKSFIKAYYQNMALWKIAKILRVNIGGLEAAAYVLKRK